MRGKDEETSETAKALRAMGHFRDGISDVHLGAGTGPVRPLWVQRELRHGEKFFGRWCGNFGRKKLRLLTEGTLLRITTSLCVRAPARECEALIGGHVVNMASLGKAAESGKIELESVT